MDDVAWHLSASILNIYLPLKTFHVSKFISPNIKKVYCSTYSVISLWSSWANPLANNRANRRTKKNKVCNDVWGVPSGAMRRNDSIGSRRKSPKNVDILVGMGRLGSSKAAWSLASPWSPHPFSGRKVCRNVPEFWFITLTEKVTKASGFSNLDLVIEG